MGKRAGDGDRDVLSVGDKMSGHLRDQGAHRNSTSTLNSTRELWAVLCSGTTHSPPRKVHKTGQQ